MSGNVINLADKMKVDPEVRSFLTCIDVGREVKEALDIVLPNMTQNEQRVMVAVVSFRMMGGMLPASLELMRRLPIFQGVHPENIGIACDFLNTNGVLTVVFDDGGEAAFVWEALERLMDQAVVNANTSGIVGTDGNRIF